MMLSTSEIVLLAIIIVVTLIFHKWPHISRGVARMRLRRDPDLPGDVVDAVILEEESDQS